MGMRVLAGWDGFQLTRLQAVCVMTRTGVGCLGFVAGLQAACGCFKPLSSRLVPHYLGGGKPCECKEGGFPRGC